MRNTGCTSLSFLSYAFSNIDWISIWYVVCLLLACLVCHVLESKVKNELWRLCSKGLLIRMTYFTNTELAVRPVHKYRL